MSEEYKNINTPMELFEFMNQNISYGYLGRNDKIYYFGDKNFNKDWEKFYILQGVDDILNTKVGTCFDQVEFAREWFILHNYEIKVFFHMIVLSYSNSYPSHTFLIYKDKVDNNWCWFENAWYELKGIHKFSTVDELLKFEYNENLKLLKDYNIKEEELNNFVIREISKPNRHISANDYIAFCLK